MSNIKFVIHLFVLLLLQLTILDNIQLHSYVYINIYILAIYILPYRLRNATILFFGFFLGLIMDLADNTVGIHAAASTFIAYIRPRLLQLTSTREEIDDTHGGQGLTDVRWFLKYTFVSTLLFNVVLILTEAFTFNDMLISIIRIILSTFISMLFMLLYYFIGIKKVQQ